MQLGSDLYYCTSWLLYIFRAPLAPIIRSATVHAVSGKSHTSDNRLPTWPSLYYITLHVSGASCTHHQEHNCKCKPLAQVTPRITAFLRGRVWTLNYSTCFGRLLHPSSGAQLYMQPLAQVTPRITAFLHGRRPRRNALGSTQPLTEMSTRRISWG